MPPFDDDAFLRAGVGVMGKYGADAFPRIGRAAAGSLKAEFEVGVNGYGRVTICCREQKRQDLMRVQVQQHAFFGER